MKKYIPLLFVALSILMTSCADAVNIEPCAIGQYEYGFFSGCWHGSIVFFSLIGSIFSDNIAVYAVNNSGFGYDFGFFVCGIAGLVAIVKYGLLLILKILS